VGYRRTHCGAVTDFENRIVTRIGGVVGYPGRVSPFGVPSPDSTMRVSGIRVFATASSCELQGRVESDRAADDDDWFEPFTLWYRFPSWCTPFLSRDNGDPFLAALLLAAMRTAEPLTIPSPVSGRLLAALPDIQAIYAAFDPDATRIPVNAVAREDGASAARGDAGVGLFFSLGVDSYYSLLKNGRDHPDDEQSMTHLLFVHGFEVAYVRWDATVPSPIRQNLHRVSHEMGKTALPVVTNVQHVVAPLAPWTMAHGGGLASVALALGGLLGRVHIAATTTYDQLYPWGTHPILDPRWSTENLTILHDGCEMHTIDKTAFIASSPLVLETLRVCPGFDPRYNCGACIKCLRTMIDLTLVGALDRCQTLPHTIDPTRLHAALRVGLGPEHIANYGRRLDSLEAAGAPRELCDALAAHLALVSEPRSTRASPRQRLVRRWRRRIADLR
jgi:hypothetical protein